MQTVTRKFLAASALAAAMLATTAMPLWARPKATSGKTGESTMPKVGEMAPNFTLKYFDGSDLKDVSLSQYRGKKNVVLAFYIFAFTGG